MKSAFSIFLSSKAKRNLTLISPDYEMALDDKPGEIVEDDDGAGEADSDTGNDEHEDGAQRLGESEGDADDTEKKESRVLDNDALAAELSNSHSHDGIMGSSHACATQATDMECAHDVREREEYSAQAPAVRRDIS